MKRLGGLLVGLLLGLGAVASQASADVLVLGSNDLFFNNFENLFDASGTIKSPTATPVVGDYLAGILNVQNVDTDGTTHYFSSPLTQLSGVFAQQIIEVKSDPITGILHLTFGNPTITSFTNGAGDTWSTGLASGEMFRFYLQEPASTLFESNGTMLDDVTKATDGSLFASFGLDSTNGAGLDGIFGNGDDTGYVYSHPVLGLNPNGFAYGALNFVVNNTGFGEYRLINDLNETEIGGTWLGNQLVFVSRFDLNSSTSSPWRFASNDPAHLNPVPEVSSLWLLGMGFSGLGFASGIKKFRI